ncbi:glycerophosphodiester phosphodiesterase [Paenibacillus radicis (ex Gao et al. 2016)]|uniref:Glycerophosphoryl diester phosphodiesterase n=1 Tax=Paenibacillus radicis (ex Gao et al. 2016) TaxID=1737354 RepID=A0A917GXB2_9BACL|nr:glycerophosphodiester phosphodiesterase family protein [Paenibacillus radicis (ex Gao et al. 2016)]GGG60225.1 glycerophosphoryl diester phosphodiesterase [Paenibacillus radicis (ex Gao et al. 2016)]
MEQLKIWAHRGASAYAPENTMEAFELAVQQHADGLDITIHRTKDGEIVVIHDDTIDRTSNGKGEVADYTLAELKAFNFNAGFEDKYSRTEIPTLHEVLELVKACELELNIEENIIFSDHDRTTISLDAAKLVQEYGLTERVSFSSFNHHSMAQIKQAFPVIRTGLLYLEGLYNGGEYAKTADASALHPFFISVTPDMVTKAHNAGIRIHAWTVNEVAAVKSMIEVGADVIITDCPDICADLRDMDIHTRKDLDDQKFRANYDEVKSYSFMQSLYTKMAKNQSQEG